MENIRFHYFFELSHYSQILNDFRQRKKLGIFEFNVWYWTHELFCLIKQIRLILTLICQKDNIFSLSQRPQNPFTNPVVSPNLKIMCKFIIYHLAF